MLKEENGDAAPAGEDGAGVSGTHDDRKEATPHLSQNELAAKAQDVLAAQNDNAAESPMTPMSPGTVEQTVAILKPEAMKPRIIREIIALLKTNRFTIENMKKVWLRQDDLVPLSQPTNDKAMVTTLTWYGPPSF